MIKKILNGESKNITSAAIIIAFASLLSRLLGVLRDRALAGKFGAGDVLDAYFAAFKIPDLVYNLLVLGALSAGFIPVFVQLYQGQKKEKEAWKLANDILNIMGLGLIFISGIFILFTPWLMPFIAPGFSGEKREMAIGLSRIMFLSPLLLGISNIFGGILQSFKRFFIYSLAPILYNLGIIIGVLFFVDSLGIYGLALGVVLGALLHMLSQIPASFSLGYRYFWSFDFRSWGIKRIMRMMVPRTLGLAVSQVNLVLMTVLASFLASGSLTIFNLANNLVAFPVGIFGVSFAIASFPTLSLLAEKETKGEFRKNFSNTFRQILFFIIPFTVLFIVLRAQIVRVVLGSGNFDWSDTIITANALAFFSLSLFAQALLPLLVRAFFAYHDSRTPFYIGLVSVAVNILLAWPLANSWGVAGLAMAFSISSIVNLVLLLALLKVKLGAVDGRNISISFAKFIIAAVPMGIFVEGIKFFIEPYFGTRTFVGIMIQGSLAGVVGLIVYGLICLWLNSPEMVVFYNSLKRKLFRQALPAISDISESEEV
jgi:putative peptidoglycan lipid II flippase